MNALGLTAADLSARIHELEDEVERLRRQLGLSVTATRAGLVARTLDVTANEARMLLALYDAEGRVLTIDQLIEATETDRARPRRNQVAGLRVHVSKLRKVLGPAAILSVYGEGYLVDSALRLRMRWILHDHGAAS